MGQSGRWAMPYYSNGYAMKTAALPENGGRLTSKKLSAELLTDIGHNQFFFFPKKLLHFLFGIQFANQYRHAAMNN